MLPRRKDRERRRLVTTVAVLPRRKDRERRKRRDYSCSVGSKKKRIETGDGLATIATVRRRNILVATVAVLAPEEETERRQLSDYGCSVGAKKGNEDSDYGCSVGAKKGKGRRRRLQLVREGKTER